MSDTQDVRSPGRDRRPRLLGRRRRVDRAPAAAEHRLHQRARVRLSSTTSTRTPARSGVAWSGRRGRLRRRSAARDRQHDGEGRPLLFARRSRRGSCRRAARRGGARSRVRARARRACASSCCPPGGTDRRRTAETPRAIPAPVSATAISIVAPARRTATLNAAAHRRELQRVRQEVADDLLQARRVRQDRHQPVGDGQRQIETAGLGERPERFDRGLHDLGDVPPASNADPHLAAHDARGIEEVLDQLRLCLGVALDRVERPRSPAPGRRSRCACSTCAQPRTAFSGVRSSCDTVPRNSSFSRFDSWSSR